ncbi:Lipo-releasing system ATP-binding LolD domain protein [Xanthomonas citri pv. mangiferaeindicae LMG 941]|nr:Lipo-releasing system ATP-binding LolD domain protein [Xanthomonas citri pv. mangiferaeindicae LMG 941]
MRQPVSKANPGKEFARAFGDDGRVLAREPVRQHHVFEHRQPWQQVERLEDEPDASAPDLARRLVVEA